MQKFKDYNLILPNNLPLNKTPGKDYWSKLLERSKDQIKILWTEQQEEDERRKKFLEHVCIVGIETSKFCNRKCSYCPDSIDKYERSKQELMDKEIWNKIVAELVELNYSSTISLNLYNEALADPTIFEKIAELKSKLPNAFIKFNSNGDFLNKRVLRRLDECGLDAIFISLHPPMNKPYSDNDRVKAHQRFYKRIGYEGSIHTIINNEKIRTDLQYNKMRVLIMSDNWYANGTSRGDLVNISIASLTSRTAPCWRPIREFTISCDGNVLPCCQVFPDEPRNTKHFWGNVKDESIWKIYASNAADKWRQDLFVYKKQQSPCATCSDPSLDDPCTKSLRDIILKES